MGRGGRTPCRGIAIAWASRGPIPTGNTRSPSRSLSRSSGETLGGTIPRPATNTSIIDVAFTVSTARSRGVELAPQPGRRGQHGQLGVCHARKELRDAGVIAVLGQTTFDVEALTCPHAASTASPAQHPTFYGSQLADE